MTLFPLLSSILMDGVTLGEGCTVASSVVCEGVEVPDKVEINNCIVSRGFQCKPGGEDRTTTMTYAIHTVSN